MSYYLTIKNELIEPKHVMAMGEAVWLFMLLLDKVMAIDENGIGKVLNGRPIVFAEHIEPALGVSTRTYRRWVKTLKAGGYIRTLQAPYGLVIYVNKAEKMWGQKAKSKNTQLFTDDRSAKSGTPKKLKIAERSAKSGTGDVPKVADPPAINGTSNKDKYIDNSNNNIHAAKAAVAAKSQIAKLYYQVIKQYDLPVTNHNVIHSKIKQWEREDEQQKAINYLTFLLTQYPGLSFKYKPQINTAMDIYSKRTQIKNAMSKLITKQQERKIREA